MGDRIEPRIILLGSGVSGSLQLTVESQRTLARVGKAYALQASAHLRRLLKSQRVECVDLSDRFRAGRPFSEVYLEIADLVLARTAEEPTVVLLTPGNPLFLNSINRFLVQEARARGLSVQVHPGVSEVDALVCYLGLDVSTFGLQMFDAKQLVARRHEINPAVPLFVLQTSGFSAGDVVPDGNGTAADFAPLAGHLSRFYPLQHPVSVIYVAPKSGRTAHATAPLEKLTDLTPYLQLQSTLFIDKLRPGRANDRSVESTRG